MKSNTWKKMMAMVVAGTMVMALAGCGSTQTAGGEASTQQSGGKDVLTVGTNASFPPFEYIDGDKVVGFDMDIAQKVADKLGKTLVIEDMEFASLINAVNTGKIDFVAAGMTATAERAEQVDFSNDYFQSKQVMIVKEGNTSIVTADDLEGKTIGVQLGTTGDLFAADVEGATIEQFDKAALAVMDLVNGKIDVVIIDEEPAKNIVVNQTGVTIVAAPFVEEMYAMAVKKGNTALQDAINEVLQEMEADGSYDALFESYFGKTE